jgi:molybdopterin/thiamine biosynthesis adenylyltransferase
MENNMTHSDRQHLTRQWDIIPVDCLDQPITIIGAGAIGGATALTLAKMGFNDITVYDFDKIEVENINCQFYRFSDIGKLKVEALQEIVKDFTGVEIEVRPERYAKGMMSKGIVISAVDSMEVRRMIWENHKQFAISTRLIIDPRMGAETGLCYAMRPTDPKDIKSYEKTLYSDDNAVQERCTAKATMYTALAISAHVAKIVKDFLCTEDERYARTMQWDIGENIQKCWSNKPQEAQSV